MAQGGSSPADVTALPFWEFRFIFPEIQKFKCEKLPVVQEVNFRSNRRTQAMAPASSLLRRHGALLLAAFCAFAIDACTAFSSLSAPSLSRSAHPAVSSSSKLMLRAPVSRRETRGAGLRAMLGSGAEAPSILLAEEIFGQVTCQPAPSKRRGGRREVLQGGLEQKMKAARPSEDRKAEREGGGCSMLGFEPLGVFLWRS